MRFTKEKSDNVKHYILEKIENEDKSIAKSTADNFGINVNTVHTYINEMLDEKIIVKIKRDEYKLSENIYRHTLKRNMGELSYDMYAYEQFVYPRLKNVEKNVEQIWAYVIGEMTNNIIDHSESDAAEIEIHQDYLNTRIVLTDNGVGIFKKIKEYFNYDSLDDAIAELFKGKLTTDSKNHSGEGIFFSSRLMDKFYIISDGKIFTSNRFEDDLIADMACSNTNGTCVMMELSNFSKKIAKEIFEEYSDDDYNFSKTKIPIKNLFDDCPVSRSQAKRVCNRLEKFSEITIDFAGVEWIGQGFAHQLFVVFANEHSDIQLIPINMNEDVKKMYMHVK